MGEKPFAAQHSSKRRDSMLYPKFLRAGSKIGVTAPSSGIPEEKRKNFELSLSNIRKEGYSLVFTDDVFKTEGIASTDRYSRASELHSLIEDPSVDMVWAASGGDMLTEMLECIDYEKIAASPKWIMGYSDITGLIFPITLRCDMATVYGPNAGGFDMTELHPFLGNALSVIKGDIPLQRSSDMHERHRMKGLDGYNLDERTEWISSAGEISVSGRMLSSCIDCSQFLVGTPFAPVEEFTSKYKDDGVIWNFDNFALTSENMYYALWNMKNAGWFKNAKAVIISRVLFPGSNFEYSYLEAARNALGDIPVVLEADTGHVKPQMTLINGAMSHLKVKDGRGSIGHSLI